MRGHRDLRLVTTAAIACALAALLMPVAALSLLLVAPLALFLPGYAIVAAAFVRRSPAVPQLLTLSVGLSLAVLALGALVLNYAPGGVRGFNWALLLILVTVGACRGAALRRPAASGSQKVFALPRASRGQAALWAGAALAFVLATALAFSTLPAREAIGYTELWIQPYAGEGGGVRVGVGSDEQERTAYRLRIRLGPEEVAAVRRFALQPGESRVLRLPLAASARPRKVSAVLFRARNPGRPYRRVTTWAAAPGAPE